MRLDELVDAIDKTEHLLCVSETLAEKVLRRGGGLYSSWRSGLRSGLCTVLSTGEAIAHLVLTEIHEVSESN